MGRIGPVDQVLYGSKVLELGRCAGGIDLVVVQ